MRSKCLKIERLEDRRMLAAFSVSNLNDSGTGSLRDAIGQANGAVGADTITFAANLSGGTINLTGGELVINEALTIDARPLPANVTINANQLSRIINITPINNDFLLGGLTLTGGKTTANGSAGFGAAIRSNSREDLKLFECQIVGNTVTGANSGGGGIFSRSVLTLEDSTVENNSTMGTRSVGGGIYALVGNVTITRSVISGNSTAGSEAVGGGIWVNGTLSASQSTISNNTTSGATAHGAGIYTSSSVTLTRSTVTNNRLLADGANGGGIYVYVIGLNQGMLLDHSILSANRDSSSYDNFFGDTRISKLVDYSLVGTDVLTFGTASNYIESNDPLLGPLAHNGGLTKTHPLLAGSPAINAGKPGLVVNPNEFDQRGTPFRRIVGGRIDIGAFELQTADFDGDGDMDGRDFLRWQRGDSPNPFSGGDLSSWQGQYGAGGLSAISSELSATPGNADFGLRNSELEFWVPAFAGMTAENAAMTTSMAESRGRETASDVEDVMNDESTEEIDQVFEEWGALPRGTIREFGEIAVRREVPARVAMIVEFASEI